MTLQDHPASPPVPEPGGAGLPALVQRPGKHPRVAWWYWLRHPWRAAWITSLIREAFRWRAAPNPQPARLTWTEELLLRRGQRAQQKAVDAVAARVERLAGEFRALRARAARERTLAQRAQARRVLPGSGTYVYTAGPITAAEAGQVIDQCRQRIAEDTERGDTRHQQRPSKTWTRAAMAPLAVDIVSLLTVIAKFFNITPDNALRKPAETATAAGFAVIASLVLALLAHSTGHTAGHLRAVDGHAGAEKEREPSSSRLVLYGKLIGLFAVSTMVAVSIATRIIHPSDTVNTGTLGVVIGILVGLTAFIAPWLLVLNQMRAVGSLEVRTIDELTGMVRGIEDAVAQHEAAAMKADEQAAGKQRSAEQARTTELAKSMQVTAMMEEVVRLARSLHTTAGRFALSGNASVDDPFLSMRSVLATDDSSIDEAMNRFDEPGAQPEDDEDDNR
ncbi:hypothetical protein [Amycolatopsis sp. NPDC098790]|uniref:hypothetical protein n=1 Tax=Amycolatopsis sp. NPDC098790 TaxID=3363939 RepID=UPI00382EF237